MKKTSKIKCVRTLAWIMTACLTLSMTAPGLTAFAAEEYEDISVSADHEADSKENGESFDMAEGKDDSQNTSGMEDTEDKTEDSEGSTENDSDPDSEDGSAVSGKSDDESDTTDGEGSADTAESDEDSATVDVDDESDRDVISDESPVNEEASKKADDSEADADYDDVKDSVREDEIDIDKTDVEKDKAVNEANEKEEDNEDPDASDGELEDDIELLHASPSEAGEDACSVGEKTYPSITDALAAIRESGGTGTVKLLADNVEDLVFDGKDGRFKVTLDMNGYDLYGRFDVKGGADVTFINGTVNSGKTNNWIYASGYDDKPTRFTLAKDATINAAKYGLCIGGVTGSKDHNGTGFVVTVDGTVDATEPESAGIWVHGNMQTTSAKICDVIVNGTVKSGMEKGSIGIAINGWGNVTINKDACIMAGTAIEVRAGSLTVNGGTIIGSTEIFESTSNTNGSTSVGGGIMINEHTTGLPITVNIRGGDISGYYAVAQDNTEGKENNINMTVTGGTFTGYDEECAILIKDFADNEEKFTIVGGTFMDSNGNVSDISVYLSDDCELDDNGNVVITKPDISEGGSEVIPDEDTDDDTGTDDSNSSDNNESAGGNTGTGGSGTHHSSRGGSGSGSSAGPAVSVPEYIGANGMKATWTLNGLRFTKADGTHPSNEYLIIDGVIYAFYTGGYAVSMDNAAYYSRDVVPPIEDIPVAAGTWDLCGWSMRYSDGSYPRSDWAHLTHNGRSDWYYFDEDGWMQTGWQQIGGCWYYFGADGAMLSNTQTPDGHRVDAGGRLIG